MDDLTNLDLAALQALLTEKRDAALAILDTEDPSADEIKQAEEFAAEFDLIEAEIAGRETAEAAETAAAAERTASLSSLRDKFAAAPEGDDEGDEGSDEGDDEGDESTDEAPAEEAAAAEAATKPAPAKRTTKAATKSKVAAANKRPAASAAAKTNTGVKIVATAGLDTHDAGQTLDGFKETAEAFASRLSSIPSFNASEAESARERGVAMQKFGVAQFKIDFPDSLTAAGKSAAEQMDVLDYARKEARLDGESLTAAGGWCAPSETIYDLCEAETLDGLLSLPEVKIARGGINYTKGPDFADFYGNGFKQTEAQAIAGATKNCYEIECPDFSEVRMDAVGLCIKVPLLTQTGYPELIQRVINGSMVAYQHWINADVIGRMVTLSGAARVITGLGSSVDDALEGLELLANQRRQQWRLALNHSLEIVVPFWVKAVYRADLARRFGVTTQAITDADIMSHFSARNLSVQFVYDWQGLDLTAEVYPETYNVLMYPAGTFVKGTADVINLSAVYDAASLSVNEYTGLFMEQGLLVAEMCHDSDLITLPICNAGRRGANDITCVTTP